MLSGAQAAGSALNIIGLQGPALTCVKQAASTVNTAPPPQPPLPVITSVLSPIPVPASLNVLALPQNFTPVSLGSMTPALNALIPVSGPGGLPKPGQVNLLPATFQMGQSNLAIRALPRAFLMPQGLTIDRAARPTSIPGNLPTIEHLIQSGKDANGLPVPLANSSILCLSLDYNCPSFQILKMNDFDSDTVDYCVNFVQTPLVKLCTEDGHTMLE